MNWAALGRDGRPEWPIGREAEDVNTYLDEASAVVTGLGGHGPPGFQGVAASESSALTPTDRAKPPFLAVENRDLLVVIGRDVGARRHRQHGESFADVPRCPRCRTRARPVDTPWSLQSNSSASRL